MSSPRIPPLRVVRSALARSRNAELVLSGVLLAVAALVASSFDAEMKPGSRLVSTLGLIVLTTLGVGLLWVALVRNRPDRAPLLLTLRDRPEQIVRIRTNDLPVGPSNARGPARDCTLTATLTDGSALSVIVKKARMPGLLSAIAQLAPGAAID